MSTHLFAMLFPGQGSQRLGMLSELAAEFSIIQNTFQTASEVLGYDTWELAQQDKHKQLNETQFTQPILLTASISLWRLWQELKGPKPSYLAGHSLGEYSALVCSEALDFSVALKLVEKRGELMQEAVPQGKGAMGVILGLSDQEVSTICLDAAEGETLTPANFNSPGQVVIAGHYAAVERALILAKEKGAALSKLLPVSVPSHCFLMEPAAQQMSHILQTTNINTPKIPIVNNVDVKICDNPEDIKDALIRQLYSPVRWTESIEFLSQKNCRLFLECGPEKVLTGLNKRIISSGICLPMSTPDAIHRALTQFST